MRLDACMLRCSGSGGDRSRGLCRDGGQPWPCTGAHHRLQDGGREVGRARCSASRPSKKRLGRRDHRAGRQVRLRDVPDYRRLGRVRHHDAERRQAPGAGRSRLLHVHSVSGRRPAGPEGSGHAFGRASDHCQPHSRRTDRSPRYFAGCPAKLTSRRGAGPSEKGGGQGPAHAGDAPDRDALGGRPPSMRQTPPPLPARRRSRVRARVASSWEPGPSASSTSNSVTKAKARKRRSTKRSTRRSASRRRRAHAGSMPTASSRAARAAPPGQFPGPIDVGGGHLDVELAGLAHRELGVEVALELGVGDGAVRRLEAEHAERPRQGDVAQHDRTRADLGEHRVHEADVGPASLTPASREQGERGTPPAHQNGFPTVT